MQIQKPIIVGIDPGTTLGLCVLDCDGKILRINSGKNRDIGSIISELISLGAIIAVGTDRKFAPNLVASVAAKTGARLISPKEDLRVAEKREMIGHENLGNDHKRDALASALYAYRQLRPLIKKIQIYCRHYGKENVMDELTSIVIRKRMKISDAVSLLERKEETVKEAKKENAQKRVLKDEDFNRLLDKIERLEKENALLRERNAALRNQLNRSGARKILVKRIVPNSKLIESKEKRILHYDGMLRTKEEELQIMGKEMEELVSMMGRLKDNFLVKRLSNLGMREFESKAMLGIQKDDIIYVGDTNIISERVLEHLKDKVMYIIYNGNLNRHLREATDFIFIDARKLKMEMGKFFCTVSKESFAKEKGSMDMFNKIVEDYKRERGL